MGSERAATSTVELNPEKKLWPCSECDHMASSLEDLGKHLEGHREVTAPTPPTKHGRPTSAPCSKGCGRHFPLKANGTPDRESKNHEKICDGRPPIVAAAAEEKAGGTPKEEAVAQSKCAKCGKPFKFQSWKDKHEKKCKGGEGAARPRRRLRALPAAAAEGGDEAREEGEKEPFVIVPGNESTLPLKQRLLNYLELEEERLTGELGRCKAYIAAVRDAAEDPVGGVIETLPGPRRAAA